MSDLIERQAAIDAILKQTVCATKRELVEICDANISDENGWLGGICIALDTIEDLPSAQPDEAKVLAEILDGCPLTYPCDKLWSPDGWCKDHCKDNYKEPSAECWLKYAEVVVSDSTDAR